MAVDSKETGRRVAAWREARKLSQQVLAERVGLDQPKLSKVESGQRRLSSGELALISYELGIDPLALIEDEPLESSSLRIAARADTEVAWECLDLALDHAKVILRAYRNLESDGFGIFDKAPFRYSGRPTVRTGSEAATALRRHLDLGDSAIFTLEDVAESLQIVVATKSFGKGLDGICVGDGNHAVAVINSDAWGSRQRFTLAHEIGHWIMGHADTESCVDANVFDGGTPSERAANAFAAAFLVPDVEVHKAASGDRADAVRLAYQYGVSLQTLGWRLHNVEGDGDLARWLRHAQPFEGAMLADCEDQYRKDAQARGRAAVSFRFEHAVRRAHAKGAMSSRQLQALVPTAEIDPGGPEW